MAEMFDTTLINKLCEIAPGWEFGAQGIAVQWQFSQQLLEALPSSTELGPVAVSLARWAWQEHPLDHRFLNLLITLHKQTDCLATLAESCENWLTLTEPQTDKENLHKLESTITILSHILPRLENNGHALFWLREGIDRAVSLGKFAAAKQCIEATPEIEGRDILVSRLLAELAVYQMPPDEALQYVEKVTHPAFTEWRLERLGRLHAKLGNTDKATELYSQLWQLMPWHPNLTMAVHAMRHPLATTQVPEDNTAPPILLYSWNKKNELKQTLESLRQSTIGASPVIVLDNGSTDGTSEMLDEIEQNWTDRTFKRIHLPVNIGAPAARNWLLSLPEVKEADWVAFLDDDIILPENWLTELWSAACQHPEASAIGCTITDAEPPYSIQCADFHMLPPEIGQRSFIDLEENIFMYSNSSGGKNSGLCSGIRPCLHVSGCCHLINMRSVEQCGAFKVHFNPSQFDDLERDLRCAQAGYHAIHHGSLRIMHLQHSSMKQADNRAKMGHIFGNKIKLEHLFPKKEAEAIRIANAKRVREDLINKTNILNEELNA